jgi:hypothetical protein
MADITVERNSELTKEVALLKSRNKTLGNIVNVDKDILIKSKEQATAMGELGENVRGIGNNLLSGAESFTTSIFGGALGGVLNSLTLGSIKRRNDNAKIEKEKAQEVAKATAEEKAINDKRMSVLVETLALSEEVSEDGRKFSELKNEEILEIIKNTELEKEKRERNEKIKEEEQKAFDFIKKENKAKENGGAQLLKENSDTSGNMDVGEKLDSIASSVEKTSVSVDKSEKKEESAEDRRERLRNAREAKGLGGVVKLEGAEDKSGFSLMDIFKKGGRGKLLGSLATGLTGIGSFAFSKEGGLFSAMKGVQFGKMAGFGLLTAGLVGLAVGGVQGLAKAKEWGTGEAAATLGGVLGGADKGVLNSLGQAAKFGAIGAGLGSVFPVIGTVIGGVIGALLGAFLGFFGGEKIAKAIEKMNKFLGGTWKAIKVAMGIDTYTDSEIVENIENEKKEIDEEIVRLKKEQEIRGKAKNSRDRFKDTELTSLIEKRTAMDTNTSAEITKRTAESALTRQENTATLKASGGDDRGGTNILTKGFFGAKFLFDAVPALRGMLDPELAKAHYNKDDTLFNRGDPEMAMAKGGFIVNKPTYLSDSGVMVGDSVSGATRDGGSEAVIPLNSPQAAAFIDPMARSVAGSVMNRLQMEGMSGGAGGSGASVVTGNDMSSSQTNNSTTVINNPSPIGQMLPDEGRSFVSKVA